MPRGRDPLWEYVIMDIGKVRCSFCNQEFVGAGITRMKYHLAKIAQKDVRPCTMVNDVVLEMAKKSIQQMEDNRSRSKKAKISDYMASMGSSSGVQPLNPHGSGDSNQSNPSHLHGSSTIPPQQTLNTLWKKEEKVAVDRLLSIALIDNNIPPYILRRESFINFVVAVANHGPGYYPPSSEKYRTTLLASLKEEAHEYVKSVQKSWEFTGCTIMSDGWKDGRSRPHTNLLVSSPKGSVFWKSECTVGKKDAKFVADFIGAAIEEIGAHNVVQVVSDNASTYIAAGHILEDRYPNIFKTNCAAHCLDLILEDIDKLPHVKSILEDARNIVKFMYKTQKVLDLMRAQTGGRELKRPGKTRFASQFLCLQSILKEEQPLRFLVASEEWRSADQCKSEEGLEVTLIIQGNTFWEAGRELIAVAVPLVKVLRLVDGDGSTTGYIYEAMDRAKEAIKKIYDDKFEKYSLFWEIIDRRWNKNLHSPLHAAAAYLNPQFWYKGITRYILTFNIPFLIYYFYFMLYSY